MSKLSNIDLVRQLEDVGIEIKDIKNQEACCFCPTHPDEHPSFFFNLDTQLYQCFGCSLRGKGIEKLRLDVTGILVKQSPEIECIIKKKIKNVVPSIIESPLAIGNRGEKYLVNRGITLDSIRTWNIYYSDYEKSVIIPLGKVGYVSRFFFPQEHDNKKYKYVYGSNIDSDLFGSEKFILNGTINGAILVEGAFDVIYLHQLGYKSALALLHSDISPQQIKVLHGLTSIIYTMFDSDVGGLEIEAKTTKKLKRGGFIVKRCKLPENKDPNDCTKEEIVQALKNSKY